MKLPPLLCLTLLAKAAAGLLWIAGAPTAVVVLTFFGPHPFVLYHVFAPSAGGLCRVFTRFETSRSEIWLTIDDGPDEHDTPQILQLLDRYGARATFFVIGERAAQQPDLIAEILRRGHDVGHHTQTHPAGSLWCASLRRLRRELDQPLGVLRAAGMRPAWFRAPAGIKHLFLAPELEARALGYVGWTIRSGDCMGHRPEKVVASVLRRLRPGAIVLMHEGPSLRPALRVTTLALLLEQLAARNYCCVLPTAAQLR